MIKKFITVEETTTHNIYRFCWGGVKFKFRKNLNNKILLINPDGSESELKKVKGLKVIFNGKNSTVKIYAPIPNFVESLIICGNNADVVIKKTSNRIAKISIHAKADYSKCYIDENFSLRNGCSLIITKEANKKISIGKNCMFAGNILIRTTDSHTIIDNKTGNVINKGKDVIIGDDVWVANDVMILKGVSVASGCVIGARSVVTKSCTDANSIYVGNPARKIKSDIKWFVAGVDEYLEKQNS